MRIEEIQKNTLTGLADNALFDLRLRVVQVYNKHFKPNSKTVLEGLTRTELFDKYSDLTVEIGKRGLKGNWSDLDSALLRHKMMDGLDPTQLEEVIMKDSCIYVGGVFATNPREADICEIFISDTLDVENSSILAKRLEIVLSKQLSKPVHVKFGDIHAHDNETILPLFDLKLVPRMSLEKSMVQPVPVNEDMSALATYCKNCGMSFIADSDWLECADCGTLLEKSIPSWQSMGGVCVAKPGFDIDAKIITFRVRDGKIFKNQTFKRIALVQQVPRVFGIIGVKEDSSEKVEKCYSLQGLRFHITDGWDVKSAALWIVAHKSILDVNHNLMANNTIKTLLDADEKELKKNSQSFTVFKTDVDQHIVSGIIYEPNVADAHGDAATAVEIEKAAHFFMETSQQIKVMHQDRPIAAKVIESFIAPADFTLGGQIVRKGTWFMSVRVRDENAWTAIKDGEIKGFSMGGVAKADN